MTENLIETHALTKRYGRVAALDNCTLVVPSGEVLGMLGPNGAGKTTFVRLLLGFVRPSSGTARIGSWDCFRQPLQVRRHTAYLPGEPRLFGEMRGRDVLEFFARLRGHDVYRARRIAERLDLDTTGRVRTMSTGMRQKLALAVVLSAQVPLFILDEPTSNLDPAARAAVLQLVREAKANGSTVLFSSHVLSEVEEVSDRVVMLRKGQIVCDLSMHQLRKRHRLYLRLAPDSSPLDCPPDIVDHVRITLLQPQKYCVETDRSLGPVLRWLAGWNIEELRMESASLRSVYEQYFASGELGG